MPPRSPAPHGVALAEAVRVWGHVGLNSFSGPAGQISVMHRELVERRRWVSERRFLHALNYGMVLPGPEATQLATYVGWLMHGVLGGVVAGVLFVLLLAFAVPFPVVVLGTGLAGWLLGRRDPHAFPTGTHPDDGADDASRALLPDDEHVDRRTARRARAAAAACLVLWLAPVVALWSTLGSDNVLTQQAVLFARAAVVTFGGAYAVLGCVAQQAVGRYGWITPTDMVTGLGLAETTPGPLIMVVQFVGFLAAYNDPGSLVGLGHALAAIGATVAGVVLSLAVWFALHTAVGQVDEWTAGPLHLPVPVLDTVRWGSVAISAVAAVLVFRLRLETLRVITVAAVLGVPASAVGLT